MADRDKKAFKLVQDKKVRSMGKADVYLVQGGLNVYKVLLYENALQEGVLKTSCTCEDFQYRDVRCKHIRAAQMQRRIDYTKTGEQ